MDKEKKSGTWVNPDFKYMTPSEFLKEKRRLEARIRDMEFCEFLFKKWG